VPTFERLPRFDREFRRLPRELQRVAVEELSESEAESALDYIASRRHGELGELLDSAPVDDEPRTPEEEAAR
jgi:hypothetical protein